LSVQRISARGVLQIHAEKYDFVNKNADLYSPSIQPGSRPTRSAGARTRA
jgi:hypothetical protein